MKLEHFTIPQLIEIAKALNLPHEHLNEECLPIRDGFVKKGDIIWWRGINGPEYTKADEKHWYNIQSYPYLYQSTEPKTKIEYVD